MGAKARAPAAVLVFVRAPVAGQVKKRLARALGAERALRIYRRLAEQAVSAARGLGLRADVRVLFTPAGSAPEVRVWLGEDAAYFPQRGDDLGERMRRACQDAFAAGYRRVLVIGSDLPAMTTPLLETALDLLEQHPAVIGPAADGGYYLLGLQQPLELFEDVPWSTSAVLDCTLHHLRAVAITPALLPELADVDEMTDLPPNLRGL
jgi:uncharacterized protein